MAASFLEKVHPTRSNIASIAMSHSALTVSIKSRRPIFIEMITKIQSALLVDSDWNNIKWARLMGQCLLSLSDEPNTEQLVFFGFHAVNIEPESSLDINDIL